MLSSFFSILLIFVLVLWQYKTKQLSRDKYQYIIINTHEKLGGFFNADSERKYA